MIKVLSRLTAILIAVVFVGCTEQYESANNRAERVIGITDKYEIVQVNDSVIVCLPRFKADKSLQPTVINLKNVK